MSPLNCPISNNTNEIMTTLEMTDLKTRVANWTQTYADAITENYRRYHLNMLTREGHPYPEYAKEQLDEIENGTANLMYFTINNGKKYYKIVQMEFDTFQNRNEYREGSVHAFVNKETGQVYKPASWNRPAKHVRYDMRIIKEREFLFNPNNTSWAGGYLYMR